MRRLPFLVPAFVLSLLVGSISGLSFVAPACADEVAPEERVFVALDAPSATVYVGQVFELTLRVGYEPDWLEANGVELFRRSMDVQLHVSAPWLLALPGTRRLACAPRESEPERLRLALNDEVVAFARGADALRDRRMRTVLEYPACFAATEPGVLKIPAPTLRFAYGTRFEEDFVGGRVATDRHDVVVRGEGLTLKVLPLPEKGRPEGFGGAVGTFEVSAELNEEGYEEDGFVRLTLNVTGEGNFGDFEAPRLDDGEGIHVFGTSESEAPGRQSIVYELAPTRADVISLPPIHFSFFSPGNDPGFDTGGQSGYRTVSTLPLRLSVRAPESATSEGDEEPGAPGDRTPNGQDGDFLHPWFVALGLVLLGLVAFLIGRGFPRPREAAPEDAAPDDSLPDDAQPLPRREAAGAARTALLSVDGDRSAAFAAYLAAWLGCPAAAVIGPDLAARLVAAGVPPALAERAAGALEHSVAARYGGAAAPEAIPDELIAELHAAFE